jgi:pSer/pThr/pTyr-binding forkhead associated (FHA) protein
VAELRQYQCESQGHLYFFTAADAENRCCDSDRSRLVPVDPPASAPVVVPTAGGALRPVLAVNITFGETVVTATPGEQVMMGRDPEYSPYAEFFGQHTHVSRRHAVLGLENDGRAWIRDCYSTNLTRVNAEPLPAGAERELRHKDQVRLCAAVIGMVGLVRKNSDDA